jgi:putative glycosyltransferase
MEPTSSSAAVPPVRLSVVTSMYRSASFLEEFYRRTVKAISAISSSYEIVLVNDGSPDDSLDIALRLRERDPRVRIVDLSRNFGHHKALMTGLARAAGELVFLLDCDLEEDPEWLLRFHELMTRSGADVVYGVQSARKGDLFERATGALFFGIFNKLLAEPIPHNVVTARLMTRRYVAALVAHRDRELCLAGLWVITGFDQRPLDVVKRSRPGSSYTTRRRISALVNAVTSFSNRPLVYIFYIGMAVMLLSAFQAGWLVYRSVTHGIGVPGYASVMVSIWFLGGLTIFCLGIIGIYLAKVFSESKDRPYTIVRAEYGGHVPNEQSASHSSSSAVLRG